MTTTRVLEIVENGVVVYAGRGSETLHADTIVMGTAPKSNNSLASDLNDVIAEVYQIGDALSPRKIDEAMEEASYIGLTSVTIM